MTIERPIEESAAVASQPAVASPEPAPSSGVVVAAVPAATPIAADAPAISEPPVVPAVATEEQPKLDETLLAKFDKQAAADPEAKKVAPAAEAPKPGDAAASGEAAPVEAPVLATVAYEYVLPETLKMDDALKGEVHSAFDAFRADPAKGAQGLLDMHAKMMSDYAGNLLKEQYRTFNETRKSWVTEVMADPDLGGSGHQTAMGAIARMRDQFVSEKDRPAFEQFLQVTGAGDHPQVLKLLRNVARIYDEPPLPPANPKPTPTNGQPPKKGMSSLYNK